MTAFTPGPWAEPRVYRDPSNRPYNIAIYGDHGTATVHQHRIDPNVTDKGFQEAVANATLIAAAPELLAALRAMVQAFDQFDDGASAEHILEPARAAIEKATGD